LWYFTEAEAHSPHRHESHRPPNRPSSLPFRDDAGLKQELLRLRELYEVPDEVGGLPLKRK
jgi:hypothetical protein